MKFKIHNMVQSKYSKIKFKYLTTVVLVNIATMLKLVEAYPPSDNKSSIHIRSPFYGSSPYGLQGRVYVYGGINSENGCDLDKYKKVIDYEKCGTYHKCEEGRRTTTEICQEGYSFSDGDQRCTDDPLCPIKHPQNQGDLRCDKNFDRHMDPKNCSRYYTCYWTGEYYTITYGDCPKTYPWYFEKEKRCDHAVRIGNQCPQDVLTEAPEKWCDGRKKDWDDYTQNPEKCNGYYLCYYGQVYAKDCAEGEKFDISKPFVGGCKTGACSTAEIKVLPEGWPCVPGKVHLNRDDCQSFYKCHPCKTDAKKWCVDEFEFCKPEEYFDEASSQCVASKICPQNIFELPKSKGWHCNEEEEKHVEPDNCNNYYVCYQCNKEGGWCYEPQSCEDDEYFDESTKECVSSSVCPQLWEDLPEEDGWRCSEENEMHDVPGNCSEYYTCYKCDRPSEWCIIKRSCEPGENFDDELKECVEGRCPQSTQPEPEGLNCTGGKQYAMDPRFCKGYIDCTKCKNGVCGMTEVCTEPDEWFDDALQGCTSNEVDQCPQDFVDLPDAPGWQCNAELEEHLDPHDCTKYYTCIRCKKSKNGWCYLPSTCDQPGFFDNITKACIESEKCPQELTEIGNEPDWSCTEEGEINVFPGDCSKYYKCYSCSKPKQWCYHKPIHCPDGKMFDQYSKECIKGTCPQDWPQVLDPTQCKKDRESHVLPKDCSKYMTCHKCYKPSGWCSSEHTCPRRHNFDNARKVCVESECPQKATTTTKKPDGRCLFGACLSGNSNPFQGLCEPVDRAVVIPAGCEKYYKCFKCDIANKGCKWLPTCYMGFFSISPRGPICALKTSIHNCLRYMFPTLSWLLG